MWKHLYSLHHPATSIPYPRFTKIIISHYMTIFPDISRRARDAYHNLQDDDIMKNIFNSGRNKNKVRMRIPAWMITDEMKLRRIIRCIHEVFGLDVPLTQSQPTESTHGTHRTLIAPRSHNPAMEKTESMPTAEKADEMILQDMIQVSLAEQKSCEKQKARENVALVGAQELIRSLEVEMVDDEEDEITDEVFELTRRTDDMVLICHLKKRFLHRHQVIKLAGNLHYVMMETLPSLVTEKVTEQVKKEVPAQVRDQVSVYLARKG
ncbi:hypothetical protein Tco_0582491 [Tanacetum coccineum]